jgi:hypothetical protein
MRERVCDGVSYRSDIGFFYFQGFMLTGVGSGYGPELFDLDC